MKVYKNARGNDQRNAQKSIDCCHHFCRLSVYIETKYSHFIPVVVHIMSRARPLALSVYSRRNKMKKLIMMKQIGLSYSLYVLFSKWENKTHKFDL